MTALSRSLEDFATLAGCPEAQHRHRLDCLVRHLRAAGDDQVWPRAVALGLDTGADVIEISAGIGHLRATPTHTTWSPTVRGTPAPPRLPASEVLRAARVQICTSCSSYRDSRCSVAGCGCSGLGDPVEQHSRCPLGRWAPAER